LSNTNPTKTGSELNSSRNVRSSCSTCDICRFTAKRRTSSDLEIVLETQVYVNKYK